MKFLTTLLNYLHLFVILIIFSGLLVVAGVSLMALSPVGLEDYQRYQAALNQLQGDRDELDAATDGEVAGISSGGNLQDIIYENLLTGKDYAYKLRTDNNNLFLELSVPEVAKVSQAGKTFKLVRLENTSQTIQQIKVNFTNKSALNIVAGIQTDISKSITSKYYTQPVTETILESLTMDLVTANEQEVRSYEFKLEPGQLATLSLLSDYNASELIDTKLDFNLDISTQALGSPISSLP